MGVIFLRRAALLDVLARPAYFQGIQAYAGTAISGFAIARFYFFRLVGSGELPKV